MSVEGIAQRASRLKGELERIRSLLAAQPTVQQVIVFGSTATGQTHEWSDLDVMVIEESEAPFVERGLRLARLVRPQVGTQFLVYTPEEMQALAHRPFVQVEMLGKGKVLPMHPYLDAQRWLTFAEQDLRMAELALDAGIFNQTCFHAQQCVEKCLKACLAAGGALLPRTHLIADLLQQLPATAQGAVAGLEHDLLTLDQFYIPTRYPDALPGSLPAGLPQQSHAAMALAIARGCFEGTRQWRAGLTGSG
jgi:HEPN domain-containing protein/predicted nucleotidyltransferase